jgi:hypothetical protein
MINIFKKETCSVCQQPIKDKSFLARPGVAPCPKGMCVWCWDLEVSFNRLTQLNPDRSALWLKKKAGSMRIKTFEDESK